MPKAVCLVRFKDLLEENPEEHFGILFEDGFIVCFCCGGCLEPEDYEIIEKFDGFPRLDAIMKAEFEA